MPPLPRICILWVIYTTPMHNTTRNNNKTLNNKEDKYVDLLNYHCIIKNIIIVIISVYRFVK